MTPGDFIEWTYKSNGECFTPRPLVVEMLKRLPHELFTDPTKTFLDNSCGDGAFLSVIVFIKVKSGSTPLQALSTTYGCDIMPDNVLDCRERMLVQAEKASGSTRTDEWISAVKKNVQCHDSLMYDFEFKEEQEVTLPETVDGPQGASPSPQAAPQITPEARTVVTTSTIKGPCTVYFINAGRKFVHVRKLGRAYGPGAEASALDLKNKVNVVVSPDGMTASVSQGDASVTETWPLLGPYEGSTVALAEGAQLATIAPAEAKLERARKTFREGHKERVKHIETILNETAMDQPTPQVEENTSPAISSVANAIAQARKRAGR